MNILNHNLPEKVNENQLNSGAKWTIYAGRAMRIVNSETLNEWSFVRCKILNPGGSYWVWARFLDIPKRNLLKVINWEQVFAPIRAIWEDWNKSWGPINETGGLHIDSYNPESHTIQVTWNFWANFEVELPIVFTDNSIEYPYDNKIKGLYNKNWNNHILIDQLTNFIKNNQD